MAVISNLTGTWSADDGGVYFVRHIDSVLWWVGMSTQSTLGEHDFQLGMDFTNVFRGDIFDSIVFGDWADVPRGKILQNGTLTLQVDSDHEIHSLESTGGFGGSRWTKIAGVRSVDIVSRFRRVMRNDGNPMGDFDPDATNNGHLKLYKDNVVAYGTVTEDLTANYPPGAPSRVPNVGRSYSNFMCTPWWIPIFGPDGFPIDRIGVGDPPDGDINFNLRVDRTAQDNTLNTGLDVQPDFWNRLNGWLNEPDEIKAKLDFNHNNNLHLEIIMYGRSPGTDDCPDVHDVPALLPGWMERGANSVLLNGQPIAGFVDISPPGPGSVRIFNRNLLAGTRVRVTGALVLDGHSFIDEFGEDDEDDNNVEIHPVYSIDVIQPGTRANLTGGWSADDVGTYYVRQIGDAVWWLGLSRDRGLTFTNVFRGRVRAEIDGTFVQGEWADVPQGLAENSGTLSLNAPDFATLNSIDTTGGFGARRWEKMYEAGIPVIQPD